VYVIALYGQRALTRKSERLSGAVCVWSGPGLCAQTFTQVFRTVMHLSRGEEWSIGNLSLGSLSKLLEPVQGFELKAVIGSREPLWVQLNPDAQISTAADWWERSSRRTHCSKLAKWEKEKNSNDDRHYASFFLFICVSHNLWGTPAVRTINHATSFMLMSVVCLSIYTVYIDIYINKQVYIL